jgi:hypothetical protein
MSDDTERIPVPTNGRGPHPAGLLEPAPAPMPEAPDEPPMREQAVPFTPNQLAVGFGIVAGLVLLLVGARRRGRSGRDE